MNKLTKLAIILVVLGLVGYGVYRYYLPTMIAQALTSDTPSRMVPKRVQKKVDSLKVKVNKEIKNLPQLMKESSIGFDDVLIMIDRSKPDQFFAAYDELQATEIVSTNQVFDIGMKHIKIEGYVLENFRTSFNRYATVDRIKGTMNRIEQNELLTSISVPVAKETAKKILISKKDEIEAKLSEMKN